MRLLLALTFATAVALARLPVALAHVNIWAVYETHSGTIAQAIVDGLDLDVGKLPIFVHVRGGVFLSLLIAPLYALFGTNSLVLKMAPLLWHACTVGLLVYVLDRFFSRRAAVTGGLLMLFAPPMMAKLAVLGLGSHMESSLFLLLALIPFFAITLEKRTSILLFFLFGLVTGLSHTWHLQALLQCMILCALLVVQLPRRILGLAGLALVAGIILGALPSRFFTGISGENFATWDVLKYYLMPFGESAEGGVAAELPPVRGPTTVPGKLGELVNPGFAQMLEFYEVGPRWSLPLGWLWSVPVLFAAGWAIVQERRRLGALFVRVFRFRDVEISPVAFFPLHVLGVVVLHLWSPLTWVALTDVSSGAANRRFSPLLTSLMILAALGMAGVRRPTRRLFWLGLLVPVCLVGAVGQIGASSTTEAGRMINRGECYEWLMGQVRYASGGDDVATVDTIRKIDRGEAQFRSLRFKISMKRLDVDDPDVVEVERQLRRSRSHEYSIYRATAIGRALAEKPALLKDPSRWAIVDAAPEPLREAMLHGIGLGLPAAWPGHPEQWQSTLGVLRNVCEAVEPARAEGIAEGAGFVRGFNLDVYTHQADFMIDFAHLPEPAQAAFYRGLGWGFRQRYVRPPDHVPEGLNVMPFIPPQCVEAFTDGYLARRVPDEAAVMGADQ